MSRRGWTLLISLALAVGLGVLGGIAPVPYVALGPGPTFDTLGVVNGQAVVHIEGTETYPTSGQLNMTTVSVVDDLTMYGALGFWLSGRNALVPREEVFPPGQTDEQVERQNTELFENSETQATTAALRHLNEPTTVVVDEVLANRPSDGRLAAGDRIRAVDGRAVPTATDLVDLLSDRAVGDRVEVRYQRNEAPARTVSIVLGPGDEPNRGYLGVRVTDRPDVDFEITISLADVGGPSAGLMFALSIVDQLTPGPLTGGEFVAGTGEISTDGQVGAIGGIPFKMQRADAAGASVFLVPAGNCEEAASTAPDGLRLIRVGSLDGAVEALETLADGGQPPSC